MLRYYCKECGGGGICKHNKRRLRCVECGGSSICEHGKRREHCRECGGSSFCEHGGYKATCKRCGGSQICAHGNVRYVCKECGGKGICKHGIQRATCKTCGSQMCEHGRFFTNCGICRPHSGVTRYKRAAQVRSYDWDLSDEQTLWLLKQPCAYCGQEVAGGIDRAKNEYGYTVLNSVPCCKNCNYQKRTQTIKAYIVAVNQIARYCPDYPKFKRRWESIRRKLAKLGEQQDAALSVPMHRVSRSNRKTPDVCGVPEAPVVLMRGSVGSDAGMSSLVS
jgi:hypothetical protein